MGKIIIIKQQIITAFSFVFIYGKCPAENAGDGTSETPNLKIFWGSFPPKYPGLGRLRRVNFSSPTCTSKISRYADYRYLVAHEINAQGWKKRPCLEGNN